MKRIRWQLEEAVALYDVYVKNGRKLVVPKEKLEYLNHI